MRHSQWNCRSDFRLLYPLAANPWCQRALQSESQEVAVAGVSSDRPIFFVLLKDAFLWDFHFPTDSPGDPICIRDSCLRALDASPMEAEVEAEVEAAEAPRWETSSSASLARSSQLRFGGLWGKIAENGTRDDQTNERRDVGRNMLFHLFH